MKIIAADKIFTGKEWLYDQAIVIQNNKIEKVIPLADAGAVTFFHNAFIAPAFIDLQIYGAGEKLFAVYPEKDALQKLVQYCRAGGAAWCMPTVATHPYETFYQCIDAIRDYWNNGGTGVLGLHIEGPWINPAKRGAHVEACIHQPTMQQVKYLLDYGKDVIKIITLAPEVCSKAVIDLILSYNIVISAGHSNATYEEATQGFSHGITTATHLFNAMSPLQHRSTGMVGAVLDHSTAMSSIIPDGHHVDYAAVRIAKQVMKDRLFVITDAVTETSEGYYPHHFAGDKYDSNNILSGSALTMAKAVQNLVQHCNIDWGEALRMCSLYPARVMHLDEQYGKIAPGYATSFVVMNEQMEVLQVID
ncbi:MAG: N-acetylglucosamine-6-phosphate deacetylase [Bacteroidetes bacterium]|nr:N-acetylglucosamine-6-phosphate deacetylase [Bacteroidota bacterium]